MNRVVCTGLTLLLLLTGGCKEEKKSATTGRRDRNILMERGQLYLLELESIETDKLVGGDQAAAEFKVFGAKHQLFMWTNPGPPHVFTFGCTAPAASYGRSTYPRLRGRGDTYYVHLPRFQLKLLKDNGRTITMDIASIRIKPDEVPDDDGVVKGEFTAEIRGSFSVEFDSDRLSGEFFGSWHGSLDKSPPEVTIIAPDAGLVSGAFDVYFDEPVTSNQATSRVFLRNSKGKKLKANIEIEPTELDNYTTHIRVDPVDLLPFQEQLGLAVAIGDEKVGFADLAGNRLPRAKTKLYTTPEHPPQMNSVGHDFSKQRTKTEFKLQRDATLVDSHVGIKPNRGRFLLIKPPPAGSRYSSALIALIRIDSDTKYLQVKIAKIADTRAAETPCLRYTVAQVDGLPWSRDCGPTDVPMIPVEFGETRVFTTPWVPMTIDVEGLRDRQVVIELEARPLSPTVPMGSNPRFIVDVIRPVWEGQDPTEFEN